MISVVIPTLNAEAGLGRTLDSLSSHRVEEIIVADGGSADGTCALATSRGARLVIGAPGRGPQQRAGAAAARAPYLLFLHADTALEAGWCEEAAAFIAAPGAGERAAAFRFALDDADWRARVLERAVAARCALFALPYGDQGLLISRNFYEALGGHEPAPLFEDVALARRIGKARMTMLASRAVTSADAWRRAGYGRASARNLVLLSRYLAGADPAKLAESYRRWERTGA